MNMEKQTNKVSITDDKDAQKDTPLAKPLEEKRYVTLLRSDGTTNKIDTIDKALGLLEDMKCMPKDGFLFKKPQIKEIHTGLMYVGIFRPNGDGVVNSKNPEELEKLLHAAFDPFLYKSNDGIRSIIEVKQRTPEELIALKLDPNILTLQVSLILLLAEDVKNLIGTEITISEEIEGNRNMELNADCLIQVKLY